MQKYQNLSAKPEIIHNRGRCKLCGDIIESTDRHEFVTCRCGACSVDGVHDYLRRCLTSPDCFEELSVIKPCGDSCENNWISNPFSLSTASQKLILWAMDLTTVFTTDKHGICGNSGQKTPQGQVPWSGNGMKARKAHEMTNPRQLGW